MAKYKMEKKIKIINIEKRESFVKLEIEFEGKRYGGLLLKYGLEEENKDEQRI